MTSTITRHNDTLWARAFRSLVSFVCIVALVFPSVYTVLEPKHAFAQGFNFDELIRLASSTNQDTEQNLVPATTTDLWIKYGSSTRTTVGGGGGDGEYDEAMNDALRPVLGAVVGMAACYLGGYISSFLKSFFPWLSSPFVAAEVTAVDIPLTGTAMVVGAINMPAQKVLQGVQVFTNVPVDSVVLNYLNETEATANLATAKNTLSTAQSTTQTAAEASNNTFKECTLDGLVRMFAQMVIDAVTDSIVAWIKSGFYGAPSFVEDPGQFFMDVASYSVSAFLYKSGLDEILCEPFRLDIILGISWDFYMPDLDPLYGQLSCSLDEFFPGIEVNVGLNTDGSPRTMPGYSGNEAYGAMVNDGNIDFPGGGFPAVAAVLRNENNAFGSRIKSSEAAGQFVNQQVGRESTLLGYGKGWFSPRCNADNIESTPQTVCTPGEYVAEQVNDWSGNQLAQLELADEFAEIVNALLQLLVEKVLSEGNSLLQYRR